MTSCWIRRTSNSFRRRRPARRESVGARVLAGGHGLLVGPSRAKLASVDARRSQEGPRPLIDRGGRPGAEDRRDDDAAALAASDAVRGSHPALAEAVLLTGDAQARARATVGGSLGGSTSGDTDLAALLIALGASVEITGSGGSRTVAVEDLLASSLERGEIITAVTVPQAAAGTATAWTTRQRHPATLTPLVGVAATVTTADKGVISAARVGAHRRQRQGSASRLSGAGAPGLVQIGIDRRAAATEGAIKAAASGGAGPHDTGRPVRFHRLPHAPCSCSDRAGDFASGEGRGEIRREQRGAGDASPGPGSSNCDEEEHVATTPGRKFFDEHMALIGAGKLDEMIDTQYSADVLHISPWDIIPGTPPPHILRGREELKKFFHIYIKAQGSINIESLYDFAETGDSISFQAIFTSNTGRWVVGDAWHMRDGQIDIHYGFCHKLG